MSVTIDVPLGIQKTNSTGSALTLIAAVAGNQNLSANLAAGDSCIYKLIDANGMGWEFGIGTMTSLSPDVFTRAATPLSSSNAGASISLSAGTHTLKSVEYPAHFLPDANGDINCHGATLINAVTDGSALIHGDFSNSAEVDAPSGTNFFVNGKTGGYYAITLTANSTLDILDGGITYPANKMCKLTLIITQDATGGRSLTFPDTFLPHGDWQSIPTNAYSVTIINAVSLDNVNWTYWLEPIMPLFPVNPSMSAITGITSINSDTRNGVVMHEAADTTARTWTVASDALYPIGSSTRLLGQTGSGVLTLAMTGADTLTFAPSGGTGSRTLTAPFDAVLTKMTATDWMLSGVGIT